MASLNQSSSVWSRRRDTKDPATRRPPKADFYGRASASLMETIMRKYIAPLFVALLVAAPAGGAFAATAMAPAAKPAVSAQAEQSTSSTVKSIDLKAHTLTLADGKTYKLPTTFKDPGLRAGEKVTVHWKMNGRAYEATKVTIG